MGVRAGTGGAQTPVGVRAGTGGAQTPVGGRAGTGKPQTPCRGSLRVDAGDTRRRTMQGETILGGQRIGLAVIVEDATLYRLPLHLAKLYRGMV